MKWNGEQGVVQNIKPKTPNKTPPTTPTPQAPSTLANPAELFPSPFEAEEALEAAALATDSTAALPEEKTPAAADVKEGWAEATDERRSAALDVAPRGAQRVRRRGSGSKSEKGEGRRGKGTEREVGLTGNNLRNVSCRLFDERAETSLQSLSRTFHRRAGRDRDGVGDGRGNVGCWGGFGGGEFGRQCDRV